MHDRGEVGLLRWRNPGREGAANVMEEQTERSLLGSLRSLAPEQALEPIVGTHRSAHLN